MLGSSLLLPALGAIGYSHLVIWWLIPLGCQNTVCSFPSCAEAPAESQPLQPHCSHLLFYSSDLLVKQILIQHSLELLIPCRANLLAGCQVNEVKCQILNEMYCVKRASAEFPISHVAFAPTQGSGKFIGLIGLGSGKWVFLGCTLACGIPAELPWPRGFEGSRSYANLHKSWDM